MRRRGKPLRRGNYDRIIVSYELIRVATLSRMSSVLAVFGRSELNLGRVDDSKDGGVEMDGRFGGRGVMERIVYIRNIFVTLF